MELTGPLALPLQECILELKGTEKETSVAMNNMVDVYNLKFDPDTVEELFDFPETVLGDRLRNGWENVEVYENEGRTYYKLIGGKCPTGVIYPYSISDFINDCHRVWKKELFWDRNLLRRKFQIL